MITNTPMNAGHSGANQDLSITGVIGTLGTTDTGGTAQVLPIAVDPSTGAMYVNNLGGGSGGGGTNVNVVTGTQQTLGTVGTVQNIAGGTVATNMLSGTLNLGTVVNNGGSVAINAGTFNAGTVNVGTFVMTSGTLNVGTAVMPSGTLNVGTINTGTVSSKIALTPSAPAVGTVGTTSAQLLGSNTNRKGLVIINASGNVVNLAFNAAAVGTSGIHLPPNGVYYMDEYSFNLGTVLAIASGTGSLVPYNEFTT